LAEVLGLRILSGSKDPESEKQTGGSPWLPEQARARRGGTSADGGAVTGKGLKPLGLKVKGLPERKGRRALEVAFAGSLL
jgi:hypothetical protein